MLLEKIDLRHLSIPLKEPFTTSFETKRHIEHVLVTVSGDGIEGYGECTCNQTPYYINETTGTAWHILSEFIAPYVVGSRIESAADLLNAPRFSSVRGNYFAKAGLELAVQDLLARAKSVSLASMLGGTRRRIESGVSIGVQESAGALFAKIDAFLGQGYKRIKLKIKPGKDYDVLAAVRERFPELPLMADANSAYTLADIPMLRKLDGLHLMMIEQPLHFTDIVDHATLQKELRTPICLDESIHSTEDARKALDLGSCRIVNIKIGRVGGVNEAKKIHDICVSRDIPVWCGGMHEYGIGRAHNIAIASLPGFTLPGDIAGSDKYWREDIVDPPFIVKDGTLEVPEGPGIGVIPVKERVEKYTVAKRTFTI